MNANFKDFLHAKCVQVWLNLNVSRKSYANLVVDYNGDVKSEFKCWLTYNSLFVNDDFHRRYNQTASNILINLNSSAKVNLSRSKNHLSLKLNQKKAAVP